MKKQLLFLGAMSIVITANAQVNFNHKQLSTYAARDAKIVDLDGDGKKDIVAIKREPVSDFKLIWFQNQGSGNFSAEIVIYAGTTTGEYSEQLQVSDVDNDGDLDIVADGFFSQTIVLYVNDGAENFTRTIVDNTGFGVEGIQMIDVVNDNYPEILTSMMLYTNTVTGIDSNSTAIGPPGYSAVVNDFDGDNFEDFALLTLNDEIEIWLNNGAGGFNSPQVIDSLLDFGYYDMSVCDLDGDSIMDILYPSSDYFPNSSNVMKWYQSDGAGNFTVNNMMVVDTNYVVTYLYAADIDNDGDNDLVASMYDDVSYEGMLKCYWNDGTNIFDSANYQILDTIVDYPAFFRVDDIDNDGDLDLLTAPFISGTAGLSWFQNQVVPNAVPSPARGSTGVEHRAYPNPTTGVLNVAFSNPIGMIRVTMENLLGQTVFSSQDIGGSNVRIDISHLPAGTYFLITESHDQIHVSKVLKN